VVEATEAAPEAEAAGRGPLFGSPLPRPLSAPGKLAAVRSEPADCSTRGRDRTWTAAAAAARVAGLPAPPPPMVPGAVNVVFELLVRVNPTQVYVNPTQVCVNPTQVCVNPTLGCVLT
jgi:hypothetical protein